MLNLPSRGIVFRLNLIIFSLISLGHIAFALLVGISNYTQVIQELKKKSENVLNLSSLALQEPIWNVDDDGIVNIMNAIMSDDDVVAVKILDTDKTTEIFSQVREGFQDFTFEEEDNTNVIFMNAKVTKEEEDIGYVYIAITTEKAQNLIQFTTFLILFLMVLLIAVIGGSIYFTANKIIKAPIATLQKEADYLAQGNYAQVIHIDKSDEIGRLATSFTMMRDAIRDKIQLIEEYNFTLEQKVGKRTIELQKVNQSLEASLHKYMQAEEKIKENETQLRHITDNIPAVIAFINNDQIYRFVNLKFYQLNDHADGEIIGRSIKENLGVINYEKIKPYIEQVLSGKTISFETSITHENRKVDYRATYVPYINKGKQDGFFSCALDITEQKIIETQLIQTSKMEALGTLAGGIAHDFNNILTAILGNAEMGLVELSNEESERSLQEKNYFENISKSARRAGNLVQQILTFSRMETTRLKPVSLALIIDNALKLLRETIPTNIKIQQNLFEDGPLVMADETQVFQVILNLGTNAYHAIGENEGVIEVSLKEMTEPPPFLELEEENYLQLMIQDSGKGMTPKDQENIFDPFFTTKEVGRGTGLGLAIVHGIVESHKGKITVESKIGFGTIFSIFLPITKEAQIHEEPIKETVQTRSGTEHILIVEDETDLINLYKLFLENKGYEITVCNNGSDALSVFQENPQYFDLVLTDQAMPRMTGKQLVKELFKIRPGIPVILSTGYSESFSEEEAKELGIRLYLMKPFKMKTLQEGIEKCLS